MQSGRDGLKNAFHGQLPVHELAALVLRLNDQVAFGGEFPLQLLKKPQPLAFRNPTERRNGNTEQCLRGRFVDVLSARPRGPGEGFLPVGFNPFLTASRSIR